MAIRYGVLLNHLNEATSGTSHTVTLERSELEELIFQLEFAIDSLTPEAKNARVKQKQSELRALQHKLEKARTQ